MANRNNQNDNANETENEGQGKKGQGREDLSDAARKMSTSKDPKERSEGAREMGQAGGKARGDQRQDESED